MNFQSLATAELSALAQRLSEAAAAEADAAAAIAAAAAAEAVRAEADVSLAEARQEMTLALAQARQEADAQVAQAIAEAQAAVAHQRSRDDGVLDQIREEAATELAAARAAADAEIVRLKQQAETDAREMQTAAEVEIGSLRAAADAAARSNAAFGAMIDKLRDDRTQLAADNERLAAENAALTYERADLLERAQSANRGTVIAHLGDTIAASAAAGSIEGVVAAAARGLAGDFARIAVFAVRDRALVASFQHGFDATVGVDKVVIPLEVESFLSTSAKAQRVGVNVGYDVVAPFGGGPSVVMTLPIAAGGETVALIYADDFGRPIATDGVNERVALAEFLRTHVVLRLERLTIELKATAELRAYAQMLLDEVEYVYDSDAGAKRSDAERVDRLRENLRCARQIYQQRVTADGPAAASLLEDAIQRTLDRKAAQPFGRDLGLAVSGVNAHALRTAYAS